MSTRQRLIILLFLGLAVLSLPLIVPVLFDPDYYQASGEQNDWTPAPTDEPTATPTFPPPTQIPAAPSINENTYQGGKQSCTYTALYWASHPELWQAQVIIGEYNYTKEDATQILGANTQGVGIFLFAQLHAAFLNILYGANPSDLNQPMIGASNWLIAHPIGSIPSVTDQQIGLELAYTLQEFNTGIIGPGHCQDEPLTFEEEPGSPITSPGELTVLELTTDEPLGTDIPTATMTSTRPAGSPLPPASTATPTKKPKKEKDPKRTSPPPATEPPPPTAQPTNPPPPPPPTPAPTEPPPEPTSAPG